MAVNIFFRLRCGHRVWSRWLDYEHQAWNAAVEQGLASDDGHRVYPGPLVWVEKGFRPYARRRTVPMTEELDGQPLGNKFRNPLTPEIYDPPLFGLRDRWGSLRRDPLGGVTVAFASREEAESYARPGDVLVELDPRGQSNRRRKTVPLPQR